MSYSAIVGGKLAPRKGEKLVQLAPKHLVSAKLHEMPAAKNWGDQVPRWADPLYNDQIGDCTVAAVARFIRNALAQVGEPCPITPDDVKRIYFQLSGGADSGLIFYDVLKYAATTGICGIKIAMPIAVNWKDRHLAGIASGLCGGLLVGVQFPSVSFGQDIWHVTQDFHVAGGHAMYKVGHSPAMSNYESWGEDHDANDAWDLEWTDECYASWLVDASPPNGLNTDAIAEDFALLASM